MSIVDALSSTSLFDGVPQELLLELAKRVEVVSLLGGEILFKEGEEGEALYIVLQGRLKADQEEKGSLGEIGIGEFVGEIALITKKNRMATVRAIRDSQLLKISQECFHSFIRGYPEVLWQFAQKCIARLTQEEKVEGGHNTLRTLALIPGGEAPLSRQFVGRFLEALSKQGTVLHLTAENSEASEAWLSAQEKLFRYVVYEADSTLTPWTRKTLRQADRVLFIAAASGSCELNGIERFFFAEARAVVSELVLVQEQVNRVYAAPWLEKRQGIRCHHVNLGSEKSLSRLIRFIVGKAIALVLSGGGARGLAHVGVIKALEERNIPIDYVGGTSMGSLIGAGVGVGMDYKEIAYHTQKNVLPATQGYDYTVPLFSLKTGKGVCHALCNIFDKNLCVEDCEIPFFCISTNLSKRSMQVHKKGLLWKSVRASLSLPAIYPPMVDENGDLLVDGGIANNFPVDVMRSLINGGRIIAVNFTCPCYEKYAPMPAEMSCFCALKGALFSKKPKHMLPHIGEIIVSAMMQGSDDHQRQMEKEADFHIKVDCSEVGLMDFGAFEKIIDIGYRAAVARLKDFSLSE